MNLICGIIICLAQTVTSFLNLSDKDMLFLVCLLALILIGLSVVLGGKQGGGGDDSE